MRVAGLGAVLVLLAAGGARAQETDLGSDFRREGQALAKSCGSFSFKSIGGCAYTLFTDHPMHIAAGSIAPGNGFGLGPAFVWHKNTESWRLSWDMDAVVSTNASWRAGGYMTAVLDRHGTIVAVPGKGKHGANLVREHPVIHVYAQAISLDRVAYYGLGPDTTTADRSYFGMKETIAGVNATWPVLARWNVSVYGEANGRFVDIRPAAATPAFAQFGEGLRLAPSFAGGHVALDYSSTFREFVAGDSTYSFDRWTTELTHQFPIVTRGKATATGAWRGRQGAPAGPDECAAAGSCPAVTRDVGGSFAVSFYMNESFTSAGHMVPFYFQPTLGGSDLNGNPTLGSYADYRFRAPNTILARASFEHSVWGPIGVTAMVDEGKVALRRGDLDFTHLRHSYTVGATVRAGGFPMVWLLFSWGGGEGTHTTGAMNPSLLGGGARPGLY